MWTMNFQMFKLGLEMAEEPEIKLPTSVRSSKKQESFRKESSIYFGFIDYTKTFDCVDHKKLWKILKDMGISNHLTSLLRNLFAGQEATVITGHGTIDWFKIGKGVPQPHHTDTRTQRHTHSHYTSSLFFFLVHCTKASDCKFLKRWEYQTTLPASWETYMQVKKQQL